LREVEAICPGRPRLKCGMIGEKTITLIDPVTS
jgi:hypothetical protein